MNELMTKSLARIVNDNYKAATVFEKYHLDFCCKGKRTLEQACREKDLEVNTLIDELEQVAENNNPSVSGYFDQFSLQQLTEYIIKTHHSFVRKEIPSITAYLERVVSKHGDLHPEVYKVLDLFNMLSEEMIHHMEKEELVLFPRINEIEGRIAAGEKIIMNGSYLLSPVIIMEGEHENAGNLLEQIRELTNDYEAPTGACTTFRLVYASLRGFEFDLHHHVHLENNILFPKALAMFGQNRQYSLN